MKKYFLLTLSLYFISCSQKQPQKEIVNIYYDKAFEFLEKNENENAFQSFNNAKDVFVKTNDSFGIGKCLTNMSIIQEKEGDNFGSQESGLAAIKFFNKKESAHQQYIVAAYTVLDYRLII